MTDAWSRHRADIEAAFESGEADAHKAAYKNAGAYLEEEYAGTEAAEIPVLSPAGTVAAVSALVPADAAIILDAGCGPNPALAVELATQHPSRRVVVLDLGVGMVRLARRVAADGGASVLGVAGDVEVLPFRDGAFDATVCDDTIEHLPDDRRGASELARVTDRSGVVVISTPNRQSLEVIARKVRDRLRGKRRPAAAYYAAGSHLREYTPAELRRLTGPFLDDRGRGFVAWTDAGLARRLATLLTRAPIMRRFTRVVVLAGQPRSSVSSRTPVSRGRGGGI